MSTSTSTRTAAVARVATLVSTLVRARTSNLEPVPTVLDFKPIPYKDVGCQKPASSSHTADPVGRTILAHRATGLLKAASFIRDSRLRYIFLLDGLPLSPRHDVGGTSPEWSPRLANSWTAKPLLQFSAGTAKDEPSLNNGYVRIHSRFRP
eukprot:scaffold264113_cov33-Prasinocladus_malaysianus.AAC.1